MVKKKIRKFFNTVSIKEKMPVLFEESKRELHVFPWLTGFCIVAAAIVSIWLAMRELPERHPSES